ncbi:uncharacterized protein N7503_005154 [Penicillium pulvis]|uniref:uncharacterized protein n=1 Tax=Penicillium pulvis TaxID=1562058 RepID=UPI0025483177|nr:uncharacterized protein N7503_005154 [Penicillium pulvis]KAJ5802704.1 hypothetical protein N7503_005154 [Penicillium pulvis]
MSSVDYNINAVSSHINVVADFNADSDISRPDLDGLSAGRGGEYQEAAVKRMVDGPRLGIGKSIALD